jgi:Tfp pilus assembly protein PilP
MKKVLVFSLSIILLGGCSTSPSSQVVHSWVNQQNAQALHETTKIKPIPKEKPYKKVPFVGLTNSRDSVFKSYIKKAPKAVAIKGGVVNMSNPPLQRYNLHSLKLTGAVQRINDKGWTAIFTTPNGKVYRAITGTKIGLRASVIQSIGIAKMGAITVVVRVPEDTVGKSVEYKNIEITQKGL